MFLLVTTSLVTFVATENVIILVPVTTLWIVIEGVTYLLEWEFDFVSAETVRRNVIDMPIEASPTEAAT